MLKIFRMLRMLKMLRMIWMIRILKMLKMQKIFKMCSLFQFVMFFVRHLWATDLLEQSGVGVKAGGIEDRGRAPVELKSYNVLYPY